MGQRSLLCQSKMNKVSWVTGNRISREWIGWSIEHFFQENWRVFCGILGKALISKITGKFLAHDDNAWTMHFCKDTLLRIFPDRQGSSWSSISPAGRREKFLWLFSSWTPLSASPGPASWTARGWTGLQKRRIRCDYFIGTTGALVVITFKGVSNYPFIHSTPPHILLT